MANELRIGTLSALTGVGQDTLRAWERRYGLFSPARTAGRFRLYTEEDVGRAREMTRLIESGLAAREAAARVLAQGLVSVAAPDEPPIRAAATALHASIRAFDQAAIERAIDQVLATADLDTAIRDVFLPALAAIGEEWQAGTLSVAQEHFSVNVLRGRLLALARGWDMGLGPRVILACPPGEYHDMSLIMFGLALHRRGWRVVFLGANTPMEDVLATEERIAARLTVLFASSWDGHRALVPVLASNAARPIALGGATAGPIAEAAGCRWLWGDPVAAAEEVTREIASTSGRLR